jgi:hypothetical protein
MSLMNVVRIAKVLALLAFVLPWAAVSCNGVDLATASGVELIQGTMTENPEAGKQMNRQMESRFGNGLGGASDAADTTAGMMGPKPDFGINFFGIAAAGVIAIGLLLSLAGKGKTAARNVMVTSLLGLALCFGTVWWWKEQVKGQSARENGGAATESPFGSEGMGAMGQGMIDNMLQERFGYWIALSALAVAAGAGAIGMAGGAGAVRQDPAPTPPPPAA